VYRAAVADDRLPPLDAARLAGLAPLLRLPGRNRTKADVLRFRVDGRDIAVKDYGPRGLFVRELVGRLLIRHEAAAYRAAAGLPGVPGFVGRLGPHALATEWVEARPLALCRPEELPPRCFERVAETLAALHDRGVALADLHHRDVLVGSREVWLVDLALAWIAPPGAGWLRRAVFSRLAQLDRLALWRMQRRFAPAGAPAEPPDVSVATLRWHRRGHALKRLLDRLRGRRRG